MRYGITGMSADRHFQRLARLFVLALSGIQNREVVVGFRQFGIILRERSEHLDRVRRFVQLRKDDSFQEAGARVSGMLRQESVETVQSLGAAAQFVQLGRFLVVVR